MKRKSILMIGVCMMLVMAACGADTSKDTGTTPTNTPVSGEKTPAVEPTKAEAPETTTAPTEVPSQEPTATTAPAETEVYGAVELFNQCGVPLPEGDIVEKREDRLSVYGDLDYEDFINYVNVLTAAGYTDGEIPEKTEYNSENYECEMYNAWGGSVKIKFLYRTEEPSELRATLYPVDPPEVYGAEALFSQYEIPIPEGVKWENSENSISVRGAFSVDNLTTYLQTLVAKGYSLEGDMTHQEDGNGAITYEASLRNVKGDRIALILWCRPEHDAEFIINFHPVPGSTYGAIELFNQYGVPLPEGTVVETSANTIAVSNELDLDYLIYYIEPLGSAGFYNMTGSKDNIQSDELTVYTRVVENETGDEVTVSLAVRPDSTYFEVSFKPVPVTPTPSPSPTPAPVQYKVSDFGLPEPDFSYWFVEVTFGNEVVSGIEETENPNAEPLILPQYVFKSTADPESVFKYMQLLYDEGWGDYRHERFGTESSFWHTGRKGDYYAYVGWSQSTGETDIIITDHGNPIVESDSQPESPVTSMPSFNTDWASNEFEMLIPQPPVGESHWKTEQKDDDTYRITTYGPNLNVTVFMDYVNLLSSYGFTIEESMAEYIYIATDANGNEVKLLREGDIHQYTISKTK